MLRNYIKTALRNLVNSKFYSLLNLLGLTLGLASTLFIVLYVVEELRYDRFHTDADRIYRVRMDRYDRGSKTFESAVTFPAVGPAMERDFPEVAGYTRMLPYARGVYAYETPKGELRTFQQEQAVFADSNFFQFFSYPLLQGDPATVLQGPNKVVISETMAQLYFGEENPIGKLLTFRGEEVLEVTGVMADPQASHLIFTIAVSMATLEGFEEFETLWGWYDFYTYIKLRPATDPQTLEARFSDFINRYKGEDLQEVGWQEVFLLQPLTSIHLYSHLSWEAGVNGDGNTVYFLLLVSGLIIAIAWINFVNLTTARAMKRAREVGVRKVVGASRIQLIRQFMLESLLLNVTALALTMVFVQACLPLFNRWLQFELTTRWLFSPWGLTGLFCALGFGTIASGLYPAFRLSAFRPVRVLKGALPSAHRAFSFRQVLVVFQFTASIILIVGTLVVIQQLHFMKAQNLGIDLTQTLVVRAPSVINQETRTDRLEVFRQRVTQIPTVRSLAATSNLPGEENFAISSVRSAHEPEVYRDVYNVSVDHHFMEDFEITFLAGRNFSADYPSDTSAVILNETALKLLQFESAEAAIGEKILLNQDREETIIGVIKSYHQASLREELDPVRFILAPQYTGFYALKISATQPQQTLADLERVWQTLYPGNPMDYFFLDEHFAQQYKADEQFKDIFLLFAGLAILIACLGLFGLASYTVEQSTKEIGIRKVLGASTSSIVTLLSRDFVRLIVMALVLALPSGYFIFEQWLQNFAYRMEIPWWLFPIVGLLALLIALLTISFQSVKAALANPVSSLRSE